jgi:hypothetical protein
MRRRRLHRLRRAMRSHQLQLIRNMRLLGVGMVLRRHSMERRPWEEAEVGLCRVRFRQRLV